MTSLLIARRFNGPAGSANGGYTCGALAEISQLPAPVTVRLHTPPPLETELDLALTDEGVELRHGASVVATAVADGPEVWTETEAVDLAVARAAEAAYAGHRHHPFPTCFSCGPARAPGDGLRIFPGPVDGPGARVAASWTPASELAREGVVGVPVTWAALDCVSAWSSDLQHRPLVLGQMSARIAEAPATATAYVLVGSMLRTEGRKTWTASHLFDGEGRLLAQAEHVWIAVGRDVVASLQS